MTKYKIIYFSSAGIHSIVCTLLRVLRNVQGYNIYFIYTIHLFYFIRMHDSSYISLSIRLSQDK